MKLQEYKDLYNRLENFEDIKKVHAETGIDEELLLVIFTQRASREATRAYYRVKAQTKRLVFDWNHRQSFMQIAKRWNFSPILTAYFIMLEKGCKRKQFWAYVRDPESAKDERLVREFKEIAENDLVYSPKGMEIQHARGRWGEAKLKEWLDWKGLTHRTEKDLRTKFAKTPDCLLDKAIELNGKKIAWIESKANFADDFEFRKNAKRQLQPYVDMFGCGIVVYWFGFIEELEPPEGVVIVDGRFFEVPEHARTNGPDDARKPRPVEQSQKQRSEQQPHQHAQMRKYHHRGRRRYYPRQQMSSGQQPEQNKTG